VQRTLSDLAARAEATCASEQERAESHLTQLRLDYTRAATAPQGAATAVTAAAASAPTWADGGRPVSTDDLRALLQSLQGLTDNLIARLQGKPGLWPRNPSATFFLLLLPLPPLPSVLEGVQSVPSENRSLVVI